MYWSGCQSTGAEMRKYLTAAVSAENTSCSDARLSGAVVAVVVVHIRLSTCWRATMLSGGRLCCASWSSRKVSGATERAWGGGIWAWWGLGYMLRGNTFLGLMFGGWGRQT
jgi:hypothetical protein